MRLSRLSLAIFAALLLSPAVHAANVVASLEFVPSTLLPGVPATYVVRITNTGTTAVQLGTTYRFYLNDQNGVPRPLLRAGVIEDAQPYDVTFLSDDDESETSLAAGKTLELWFDDIVNRERRYATSPFNTAPGTVTVAIQFSADGQPVSTGPVQLKVIQPSGDDLAVWNLMQQRAGGVWSAETWDRIADLAPTVLRDYPRSHYAPYFAMRMPRVPCEIATSCVDLVPIEIALATNPPALVRDTLVAELGLEHANRATHFTSYRNIERAAEEMKIARPYLDEVLRTTRLPALRDLAEKAAHLPASASDILEYNQLLHKDAAAVPQRLTAFVDCVTIAGEVMIARFGYSNPNSEGKEIQLGSGNRFMPTPYDRGQPRLFQLGTQHNVVGASGDAKKSVTWALDGNTAVATSTSQPCGDATASAQPIRAFVECAKTDGPNMTARFGYENPNAFPVMLPVSEKNLFSSGTVKNQPVVFEPGMHRNAVTVEVRETTSVSWRLGETTAVAYASRSAPCPNN